MSDDPRDACIPIVETYRGVGIHAFQPRDRIETVVKPAVDAVYRLADPDGLTDYAMEPRNPPEARLLAAARCEALWQLAAENREIRPRVDRTLLSAYVAGLDSLAWMSPTHYGTALQHPPGPGQPAMPQRVPALPYDRQEIARLADALRAERSPSPP